MKRSAPRFIGERQGPGVAKGFTAVMARRTEPKGLDDFPTPPWATRALFEHVLPELSILIGPSLCPNGPRPSGWDPSCGRGHMTMVLEEYCEPVFATDIFDYGAGDPAKVPAGWVGEQDFLDQLAQMPKVDWIITNPPFKLALDFTLRALALARRGVAMLVRTQWIESKGRYERLFRDRPPTIFAPFVERVPMVKGVWDPTASTATSYAWFVWLVGELSTAFRTFLIPPVCRKALFLESDLRMAAPRETAGVLL